MRHEITSKWTNACIFADDFDDLGTPGKNLGELVRRAVLRGAVLSGAVLSGAVLSRAVLRGADLSGAVLSGADLSGADLSGAVLSGAVLSRADLSGADLRGAVLSRADLSGADLSGAVLSGADLSRADLRGADLRGAVLRGAVLSGAVLSGAVLSRAGKILALRALTGLYRYPIYIMVSEGLIPWVWMGCQHRTVEEWDTMGGVRDSRVSEFPNDGSIESERRARAYEFARAEVMHMVEEEKAKDAATRN